MRSKLSLIPKISNAFASSTNQEIDQSVQSSLFRTWQTITEGKNNAIEAKTKILYFL